MKIIDSDAFLDMPLTTQALYFHLSMRADDDGFVNNPKRIQRLIGASDDDMRVLVTKRFILTFESGIIVIKHWRIHNYIQNDRYHKTQYTEELETLAIKENGAYTDKCIQNGYKLDTEVSIGKDSIDKSRLVKSSKDKEKDNYYLREKEKEKENPDGGGSVESLKACHEAFMQAMGEDKSIEPNNR